MSSKSPVYLFHLNFIKTLMPHYITIYSKLWQVMSRTPGWSKASDHVPFLGCQMCIVSSQQKSQMQKRMLNCGRGTFHNGQNGTESKVEGRSCRGTLVQSEGFTFLVPQEWLLYPECKCWRSSCATLACSAPWQCSPRSLRPWVILVVQRITCKVRNSFKAIPYSWNSCNGVCCPCSSIIKEHHFCEPSQH